MGELFLFAIMFIGVAFLSLLSIKQIVILLAGTVVAAAVLLSAIRAFVHVYADRFCSVHHEGLISRGTMMCSQ